MALKPMEFLKESEANRKIPSCVALKDDLRGDTPDGGDHGHGHGRGYAHCGHGPRDGA